MAVRVVQVDRRKLTFLESLYVPEIVRGLGVTLRHLFVNLWGFVVRRRKIFTVYYPEERFPLPDAFRGMPVLVQRPDETTRCVACGLCEVACPTNCIFIIPSETERSVERYPKVFDIDISRCLFCGLCEEACPEEAIVMSDRLEISTDFREGLVYRRQDLLVPEGELGNRLRHLKKAYNWRSPDAPVL